jgi:hypothetical protein
MGSDNQWTALGPAIIGFQTDSTDIDRGAEIGGNSLGVKGTCLGAVGDGAQGFGAGDFSGVAGFGADAADHDHNPGTGVYAQGGIPFESLLGGGAPGVRGYGGGARPGGPPGSNAVGV